ncbi:hypothetical protein [Rosenbergiella epipactidis]|uniref:hypothetical protein n=1 Tax=Rosenbergiella epipactidis TaxID=1544694 RepID=UPI001F4EA3EF|nr:hypothetical protein [Rosenbergiella epipactidis]
MNQRLIIIVAIVFFLLGLVGIYLSESEEAVSVDDAQQQSRQQATYFISKRIMAAGELITKDDYEEKNEELLEASPNPDNPDTVEGFYLTEAVRKGTTLTKSLLTKDKSEEHFSSTHYRYTLELNKQYINNIIGLLPGAKVDVYIKFKSPRREQDNKSTVFRGQSIVKIVKIFKNKTLLTPVMKGKKIISEGSNENDYINQYNVDIELTRADLKKIYQIENEFEMIVFPAESSEKNNTRVSIINNEGNK